MTRPAPVDLERVAVAHLLLDADLVAFATSDGVSVELPEDLDRHRGERLPYLRLFKLPGSYVDDETAVLEAGRLQFDAWGATKAEAFDLAQLAVRALLEAQDVTHEGAVVTRVNLDATPFWSPDPETDLPRYIFTATVFAHPRPPTGS